MTDLQRLAILYAAPLVWEDDQEQVHALNVLPFEAEREVLFESLTEAGRLLEVRLEAATVGNLRTLVTLGYQALHYSGHGDPHFLAFEDGKGSTHCLDAATLQRLVAAGDTRRDFDFHRHDPLDSISQILPWP